MSEEQAPVETAGETPEQDAPETQPESGQETAAPETEEAKEAREREERKARNKEFAAKRIAEREARAEARYLAEVESLRKEVEALKEAKAPSAPTSKPKADDYETFEDYLEARDVWTRQQWEQETRQKQALEGQAKEFTEKKTTFDRAEAQYKKDLGPEAARAYDEASESLTPFLVDARGQPTNPALALGLLEAGPKVVHYLAEHLDVLEELTGASETRIWRELGRIEARLSDGGREGRRHTKAPPPPPVVGGGGPGPEKSYATMSDEQFKAERLKEMGWK